MKYSETILSILFPRRCPVCDKIVMPKGALICPSCMGKLAWVRRPVCLRCGKELISSDMEYCRDCARKKRSFDRGFSLINYNEIASHSMAQIKYHNKREYLDFYAEAARRKLGASIARLAPDVMVPVPVHASRRRRRGFNQAEELARRLSEKLGIPVDSHILIRTKKTVPQKNLNPAERLRNLEQAFSVASLPPRDKTILLIDDIYTTGATAEACAKILKEAGAEKVYVFTIFTGSGN